MAVLEVRGLTKHYSVGSPFSHRFLHAADDVSFAVAPGETLALIGESGSGKSTTGRCVLRLEEPTAGEILLQGQSITKASHAELRRMRARMQMVFQDPMDSLNPRIKIGELVAEPLWLMGLISRREAAQRVRDVLDLVHLPEDAPTRYAHQLSGGQQQRVGIARALATRPDLVILDEPTSALDVSVQAQIINLLEEIQQKLNLAYLFISHDLTVVSNLADRVAVMYLGQIVEIGPTPVIFEKAAHPYTRALISATPVDYPGQYKRRIVLSGESLSPVNPKPGCRLAPRCPFAQPECVKEEIPLVEVTPDHSVRCRRFVEEQNDGVWLPDPTGWKPQ